jgi:hypothetical protein
MGAVEAADRLANAGQWQELTGVATAPQFVAGHAIDPQAVDAVALPTGRLGEDNRKSSRPGQQAHGLPGLNPPLG